MDDELKEYRKDLIERGRKANESYDKAVMTLSAGALAVSLTFIHDIAQHPIQSSIRFLVIAWSLLVFSLIAIFISLLTSQFAFRTSVTQVDKGVIHESRAGGTFALATLWLNVASAVLFTLGLVFLVVFALMNI